MTKNFTPKISVVIPMYNVEKYIGYCLESILNQTFQDFEIIVVDNCSTDNSYAVVEQYQEIFPEKIMLLTTEKNFGNGAFPRSKGIKFARGEYLFLMDSDDAITRTALEELYNVAKSFDADVVHCEKYLQCKTEGNLLGKNEYQLFAYNIKKFVTEPTLLTEDFAERVTELHDRQFMWNMWSKLIRRDFFIENNIELVNSFGEDLLITVCLVCSAKRYVRVPNVVNIYRLFENSTTNQNYKSGKVFETWLRSLFQGISYLDKFLDEQKFFKQNTRAKYVVFDAVANDMIGNYLLQYYQNFSVEHFDDVIRQTFKDVENPEAVMAFIFGRMSIFQLNSFRQQNTIQQLQTQLMNLQK